MRFSPRRLAPLLVLALSLSRPAHGQGGRPTHDIMPEDLAAALSPSSIGRTLPGTQKWWPLIPELNVWLGDPLPGERFYVVQNFQRAHDAAQGRVEATANLFTDPQAAMRAMTTIRAGDLAGARLVAGPSFGFQSYWFARPGAGSGPSAVTLRYMLGPFVGRVTLIDRGAATQPERIAPCAEAIVANLRKVWDGQLISEPLPPEVAEVLPPAAAIKALGRLVGPVGVGLDAWAIVDTARPAPAARAMLQRLGASTLGVYRFVLQKPAGHVVEVTVFPMRDADSARKWVGLFDAEVKAKKQRRLAAGSTGPGAVMRRDPEGGTYELQFARGRCAVDVFGNAPFGKTLPAVEAQVRTIAERWYAAMPGEAG